MDKWFGVYTVICHLHHAFYCALTWPVTIQPVAQKINRKRKAPSDKVVEEAEEENTMHGGRSVLIRNGFQHLTTLTNWTSVREPAEAVLVPRGPGKL